EHATVRHDLVTKTIPGQQTLDHVLSCANASTACLEYLIHVVSHGGPYLSGRVKRSGRTAAGHDCAGHHLLRVPSAWIAQAANGTGAAMSIVRKKPPWLRFSS